MRAKDLTILALAVTAGGMLAASNAAETFQVYGLSAQFANSQNIWDVTDGPQSVSGFPAVVANFSVQTDGAGKITGAGWLRVDYNLGGMPFSWFVVSVNGKISSSKAKPIPVVKMIIKGSGYTADGNGGARLNNNINLVFTGAPGIDPNNPAQQTIVGTVQGRIAGQTPLGATSAKVNVAATANSGFNTPRINGLDVVQSSRRMVLSSSAVAGKGICRKDETFSADLKGINFSKGSWLELSGTMGLYTNNVGPTPVGFYAPTSITIKNGKVAGQVISGVATAINANLIH